jgi:Flp pilus assembly protein TadG
MKKRVKNTPKQRGQSLVELGLTLIVMMWLLSGAVDFGLGFFSYVAIRDAAQEGALFGSINPPTDATEENEIISRIRSSSTSPVRLADTSLVEVVIIKPGAVCAGQPLTINLTYHYPVSMALITTVTGPTLNIRASATSTILKPVCP